VVLDTFIYHKYCKSCSVLVWILRQVHEGWCWRGNHVTNMRHNSKISWGWAFVLKQALPRDNSSFHLCYNIFVFVKKNKKWCFCGCTLHSGTCGRPREW
jgi:hypothetical protein